MHSQVEVATDPTGRTLGLSAWLEIRPINKSAARGTIETSVSNPVCCPLPKYSHTVALSVYDMHVLMVIIALVKLLYK